MRSTKSFIVAGLPLIAFTIGSWLGLSYILKDRFAIRDARVLELAGEPIYTPRVKRPTVNLEAELKATISSLDLEHYENKPVPR
eukprot:g1518.t1